MIVKALQALAQGTALASEPQSQTGVTYAHKIGKAEAALDWTQPAELLNRRIRAFDPFPGAALNHGGQTHKVWQAEVLSPSHPAAHPVPAGTVIAVDGQGPVVTCGTGALRLSQMQRPGGRRVSGAMWAEALGLQVGERLN